MLYDDPRRYFRRGLFLGLTTAEIAILLVFVLLLLFTASTMSRPGDAEEPHASAEARNKELEQQLTVLQQMNKDQGELLQTERTETENWRELAREAEARNEELEQQLAELRELALAEEQAEEEKDSVDQLRLELATSRAAARAAKQVAADLRDMIAEIRTRQAGTGPGGTGSDHPSCWYDPDGDIEYVWDIALHESGFLLREGHAPANGHRRESLPVGDTVIGEYLSEDEFLNQTKALYDYSVDQKCRFFVRAFDDTGPTAKLLYKQRMQVLERHFYKNATPSGSPPRR